jgi:branched-chain amino acid transport system substrate-binding protein
MKRASWLLICLVVALILPACRSGPAPIRIGAVYPLTGSQSPGGLDEFHGVQLAVDMVNWDGGVNGHRVELVPVDAPASDAGPAAVEQLAGSGIRMLFGSYGSTISEAAGAEAASRGMLFWETGAVGSMRGPGPGQLFFRVAPSGASLGRTAVDFIEGQLAPMLSTSSSDLRFAVTNVEDAYGDEVARGAVEQVRSLGLTLTGQFPYDLRRPDFPALVERIADSGANVVFVAAYVQDGVDMRREMVRQGLRLVAGIGTSSSYCMPEFGAALGKDAVGLFASDKPDAEYLNPSGLLPEARTVLDRAISAWTATYGHEEMSGDEEMSAPALSGFAAAWALLHDVLPRAASFAPADVARAALAVDIPQGGLPNGSGLRFGPPGSPDAGENLMATSVIWEWVGVEKREVVWPSRFATHPIEAIHPLP